MEDNYDILSTNEHTTFSQGYLAPARPVVINSEPKISIESGVEGMELKNPKLAFRRIGSDGLESCQDCWGLNTDDNGKKTIAVADGVGQALCGGWAAQSALEMLCTDFNGSLDKIKPFNLNDFNQELDSHLSSSLIKDVWRQKIDQGQIAAATFAACQISEDSLSYRKLGDAGLAIFRPTQPGQAEVVFASLGKAAEKTPDQVSWNQDKNQWQVKGAEETGNIEVQKGDVVLLFSDGLLKGGEFKGLSQEEIFMLLKQEVGKRLLTIKVKSFIPHIMAENLLDLGKADQPLDDVVVGVIVI
jgi:serine/threonine protein phosphatase PrpC